MAYAPQTWANGSGGGTPIDADRLNHIEAGIVAVDTAKADKAANLSDMASLATVKVNLGLNNVTNTSDASKPISTATATALASKADLVSGKLTIAQMAAGAELNIYCVGGTWPARPTTRTDITVNYRARAATDPNPTDFVANVDYLYRETP